VAEVSTTPFPLFQDESAGGGARREEAAADKEKMDILIVDDQPANLFALETLFAGEGYALVQAASGPEALRCVLKQEFALILLDVRMPGMDGFETASLIRKRPQSLATPIIFLTATSSNENHVGQGYSLGAVDYIYKPIVPEILKAKVRVFAELHRKSLELASSRETLRLELEERKKADAARIESEEKYRKLFSHASDAIVVFDAEGETVLDANNAALELYGYAQADFLKLALNDLCGKTKANDVATAENAPNQFLTCFQKKADGKLFPAEVAYESISLNGKKLIMMLTRDVTERLKAAETELLREREAMQRKLVSTVSHELSTPIAVIKASAETLILDKLGNAKTRSRFLQIIDKQANHLTGLVKQLLLIAELESGKMKPATSAIVLADFLKECLPGITALAKKKMVSISAQVDGKLVLRADRSHLIGIFQNLLDNAIKYNKKNGSIKIQARRNADGDAEMSVSDTGIGISAKDMPLIFQQFHRAQSVRGLGIAGTGQGLYIVKSLVERNGGRIWVESAEDKGTAFHFTLPLESE
jgi:PAS domain S-box-containing protein